MGINFTPAMDEIKITEQPRCLRTRAIPHKAEHRNAKPFRDSLSDRQNFHVSLQRNIMICWEPLQDFVHVFFPRCRQTVSSHKCQKHRLQNMQIGEIKCRKFVSRKLIQVGKKWSNKQFEILNRTFIQQIVRNFTNPLVLTFLSFLLIYRFRTPRIGNGPKIQIRKHS